MRMPRSLATGSTLIGLWAIFMVLTTGSAGGQAPLPDVDRLGPQVGERVPSFALPDAGGRERSLQALMGPKGLMLVFFRSADW